MSYSNTSYEGKKLDIKVIDNQNIRSVDKGNGVLLHWVSNILKTEGANSQLLFLTLTINPTWCSKDEDTNPGKYRDKGLNSGYISLQVNNLAGSLIRIQSKLQL